MEVRRATPEDAPALAALRVAWGDEGGVVREGFATMFEEWARGTDHTGFVAVEGGEVVGMAWLAMLERPPSPERGTRVGGDVQSVYVRASHRGRGIGSELTRAVVDEARRRGAQRVTVQSSTRAVPVYERLGFASSPKLLQLDL